MRIVAVVAFAFACFAALAACEDPRSVGLPCHMEHPPTGGQKVVETPALDCAARMCLQLAQQQPAMCTAECSQEGESCAAASSALCPGEFRCAVPFVVGPFKGRLLCVCEDFLAD